ncbi:hypothetical protein K469DRAFT_717014 [Zopfia rhizophila CBS 207.26]|uniref:DUF7730 domain-containing protein n=1 Tax=Zopfia rhizophila CBS 207.26 TaxID=1314779 RepID=A0A6A6ENC9_9PEZI|nr:hypothetical protein K469DRAFT_717014 [Zopfia rhizophila CBS 207.26]
MLHVASALRLNWSPSKRTRNWQIGNCLRHSSHVGRCKRTISKQPFSTACSASNSVPIVSRYSEAIGLLYTSNEFRFGYIWTLDFFRSTVLAKRFASIRYLHVYFDTYQYDWRSWTRNRHRDCLRPRPGPEKDWGNACDALLAMSGFREFQFHVSKTYSYMSRVILMGS